MSMESSAVGRLYRTLRAYETASQQATVHNGSVRMAWALAFGIAEDEVALHLAVVSAELLPAARQQIVDSRDPFHAEIWALHERDWFRPLLHEGVHLGQSVLDLPVTHLPYLAGLWSGLSAAGLIEGRVPNEEEVRTLIDDLTAMRAEVEQDDDMHPVVRDAMVRRLTDLIRAFSDLRRTGPAGVQAAASRILGDLSIVESIQRQPSKTLKRLGVIAYASYLAVAPAQDFMDSSKMIGSSISHGIQSVAGALVDHDVVELPKDAEEASEPGASNRAG